MKVFGGSGQGFHVAAALEKAKFSIKILSYLFLAPRSLSAPPLSKNIYQTLNQKVSEGVTIQILCNDKFPTAWLKKRLEAERERLRKMGAKVITYPRNKMLHSKLILIDDEIAFLGSMNITSDSMQRNHELIIEITEKPVIEKLDKIFLTAWKYSLNYGKEKKTEGEE